MPPAKPYYWLVVVVALVLHALAARTALDEGAGLTGPGALAVLVWAALLTHGVRDVGGRLRLDSHGAGLALVVVTLPAAQATLASAVVLAMALPPRRHPLHRTVFNAAAATVEVALCAVTLEALGGPGTDLRGVAAVSAVLVLRGLANFLLYLGLAAWVLDTPVDRFEIFDLASGRQSLQFLALGGLAGLVWNLGHPALWVLLVPGYLSIAQNFHGRAAREGFSRDAKTRLLTAGAFRTRAAREQLRSDRHGESLAVVLVDIDHFRQVNTDYGHLVGDQVLAAVARAIAAQARRYDVVARFGGEEFALVLVDRTPEEVAQTCEEIRSAVSRAAVPTRPVTVSVGATSWPSGTPLDDALERADQALYRAKDNGRDRVEMTMPVA